MLAKSAASIYRSIHYTLTFSEVLSIFVMTGENQQMDVKASFLFKLLVRYGNYIWGQSEALSQLIMFLWFLFIPQKRSLLALCLIQDRQPSSISRICLVLIVC